MWRVFNKLFGWDYVNIESCADAEVKRIWYRADGVAMVSAYGFQHWPLKDHAKHGWYKCLPLTKGALEAMDA